MAPSNTYLPLKNVVRKLPPQFPERQICEDEVSLDEEEELTRTQLSPNDARNTVWFFSVYPLAQQGYFTVGDRTELSRCPIAHSEAPNREPWCLALEEGIDSDDLLSNPTKYSAKVREQAHGCGLPTLQTR
eukprot:gene25831-biopygen9222